MSTAVRDAIAAVLESTDLSDPHEIAAEVVRRLSAKELRSALTEVLPDFVRVTMSRGRMLNPAPLAPKSSSKVAACRTHWATRLVTPLFVDGAYKRFGDCTAVDLKAVSLSLRVSADRSNAKADYYDSVAAALPEGATVSVLGEDPTERTAA